MKEFSKRFEDYFRGESYESKCDRNKIEIDHPKIDQKKFRLLVEDCADDYRDSIWDFIVKFAWLGRKFIYKDKMRGKYGGSDYKDVEVAFGIFLRNYAGVEKKMFTYPQHYSCIASYLPDFFPHFYEGASPWDRDYEFPYDNIDIDYLFFVENLPDRLDMLDRAEEENMSYAQFLDWVVNWVLCWNEAYGDTYTLQKKGAYYKIKKI